MENPEIFIGGIISVFDRRRQNENVPDVNFHALILQIVISAARGDNVYFVKGVRMHPDGIAHFVGVIIAVHKREIFIRIKKTVVRIDLG